VFSPEQMPFSGQTPWVQPIPSHDLITWSDPHTAPLLRKNKQINTVLKHTVTHQVWRISNDCVKPLCMLLRQIKGLVIVIEGEVTPILFKAVVILKQMGRHSWKAFLQFATRQHSFDFNSTPSPGPQKNENPRLFSLSASSPLVAGGGCFTASSLKVNHLTNGHTYRNLVVHFLLQCSLWKQPRLTKWR
jgi:hypothetical protein